MIKVGFIGLGNMGLAQVRAFSKVRGVSIVAGADPAPVGREAFSKLAPKASLYEDYKSLLGDKNVDAVVIVVPTFLHKGIAIEAMQSGRAVLTEKPMALNVADCRVMNDVSAKTGKLLMVAHCRRYDADWGTFGDIVRKGMLGTPVVWRQLAGGFGPNAPWFMDAAKGGGPLIDGAVHNHDFANFLFGDPVDVYALGIKLTEHTAVDTATAVVRYASGNQMTLSWAWGVAPGANGADALGTKASVTFNPPVEGEGIDRKKYVYYRVIDRATRKETMVRKPRNDMYVEQAKHFIACLNGKAECLSPGTESIKAVAVAEAILKAAPTGKIVKVKW